MGGRKLYDLIQEAMKTKGPYGIPLRCLIAKDVDNLMMAGRNVSVTHAALGTVRVMSTTALLGQAAGTAAAITLKNQLPIADVPTRAIAEVQQQLLRDGCFLPNYANQDTADLARKATVSASSQARLRGAEPDSKGAHEGLAVWRDQPQYMDETLRTRRGQLIAIGTPELRRLDVCLNNTSGKPQTITAQLRLAENIWDYRACELETLAETELTVPAGQHWIGWDVGLTNLPTGRFVRFDLLPNPQVAWLMAGRIEPGQMAMYQISESRMRRFGNGHTLSFRVNPPQACYGPENVLSGITRPYQFTNLWKSDPAQPLPQWLELAWPEPQTIQQVELTFPGHLIREYHAYGPFYRDPQCPKDYSVSALVNGDWQTVLTVDGNYQRHAKHRLPESVKTTALRVNVHATNGDPSAQIYEVRCY